MDKKAKQAIAIALAVIILFAGGYFIGMGKSISIGVNVNSGNASPAGETVAPPTAAPATQAPSAAAPTAAPATESTAATQTPSDNNTGGQSNPAETPSEPAASAPVDGSAMSTEQIVELYNSSVNRVKPEATTLTRNYKKLESLPEYLELPSAIEGIGSAAIKQFVKGSDTPESWTSKEDMQAVFPVGGTDYSSHMTSDMVESATCTDTGSAFQLEIKLYDDKITSPEKGTGYAGVFNTVTASSITEVSIPTVTFNSVDINGINGSISCTIDKESKRVTDITFRNTDILAINAKVAFSEVTAKLALAVEENYTIAY
ncbi:MAG: hypothetical protein ACI4XE_08425 [Acutalibacteraceae bacterium]